MQIADAESRFRKSPDREEIEARLANAVATLGYVGQCIVLRHDGPTRRTSIAAISSVSRPDRFSPLVAWLEERLAEACNGEEGDTGTGRFLLPVKQAPERPYPFAHGISIRLVDRFSSKLLGWLILLDEKPPEERTMAVAVRLADTAAHAIAAHGNKGWHLRRLWLRKGFFASLAGLALLSVIPVPMAVLAPAEIVPANPFVIAAPISGVIAKINVMPDQMVESGDLLVTFQKTELLSRRDIAARNADVASARLHRADQEALGSIAGAREQAIARGEYELALAELEQATRLLALSEIRAPISGIAIIADPQRLAGKPVQTGERIMRIANPEKQEVRIELPVSDAIELEPGVTGRLFRNSDPLSPLPIIMTSYSYQAQRVESGFLAHVLLAEISDPRGSPRIGQRGTAQLSGVTTTLGFFILRKPIGALRQWIGI
ncbi:MAG: HlyD family efflux transporter periplasmic adaptor subunit [Rhizobiaceae bacterium]